MFKREQVIILLQTLCNGHTKIPIYFVFSDNKNQSFCKHGSFFFVFRGPNLSAVNYQSPEKKNTRKNKAYFMLQTLFYGHNVTEMTLWKL